MDRGEELEWDGSGHRALDLGAVTPGLDLGAGSSALGDGRPSCKGPEGISGFPLGGWPFLPMDDTSGVPGVRLRGSLFFNSSFSFLHIHSYL